MSSLLLGPPSKEHAHPTGHPDRLCKARRRLRVPAAVCRILIFDFVLRGTARLPSRALAEPWCTLT